MSRPPWSEFRAALEAAGFHPSRRLGQNFLLDEALAEAIARDAELRPGERVLEVGVGCGFLSAHLLERGVQLLGVEVDGRLVRVARGFLEPLCREWPGSSFELLHTDALASKGRLDPDLEGALPVEGDWSLVANLPYSISAPLLVLLSRRPHPPRAMTALVQLEVAERICAGPGQPARGPLGVRLTALYGARILRRVSARLFWPRPKVESALVRLELCPERPSGVLLEDFDALVGGLFQQRRKGLRGALTPLAGGSRGAEQWLSRAGLEPSRRAGSLSVGDFLALAHTSSAPGIGRGPSR